jgi:hypothetical protein
MTLKVMSLMDQKAIMLYLHMSGMSLDAIDEDLMHVLGENAVAHSILTKYVRREKHPRKKEGPRLQRMNVEPGPIDQAIVTALADYPFSSVWELSRLTCLRGSTVHTHPTDSFHFRISHLPWIPHLLNPEQDRIRVNITGVLSLLHVLSVEGRRQWHDLVTLDESWFGFICAANTI